MDKALLKLLLLRSLLSLALSSGVKSSWLTFPQWFCYFGGLSLVHTSIPHMSSTKWSWWLVRDSRTMHWSAIFTFQAICDDNGPVTTITGIHLLEHEIERTSEDNRRIIIIRIPVFKEQQQQLVEFLCSSQSIALHYIYRPTEDILMGIVILLIIKSNDNVENQVRSLNYYSSCCLSDNSNRHVQAQLHDYR